MEIIKIVVLCLVLMTCYAEENTTANHFNNLMELEQHLKFHKREKQYLIEDDLSEGPEQRRDERQSNPKNNNHIEPNVNPKTVNTRLQPKIPSANKQGLKSDDLTKPIKARIDTKPQRIPTKIPVILKTAKVVPGAAHALRLKMIENENKNKEENFNKTNKGNAVELLTLSKDNIPVTTEYKESPKTESRSSPNKVDKVEVHTNQKHNVTLHNDDKKTLDHDENGAVNKESRDTLNEYGQKVSNQDDQGILNVDRKGTFGENKDESETVQNPVHFFVDEPEALPPSIKKKHKSEIPSAKIKEGVSTKIKEIPIVKKMNKKPKTDESRQQHHKTDDNTESDPDIIHISNGTHLISIKKIRNHDRYTIEHLLSRDAFEDPPETEDRMANPSPPKPLHTIEEKPVKKPLSGTELKENNTPSRIVFSDKEDKDPNNCIAIITNRKYEEFEEKAPYSSPTTIQSDASQSSWNYLQPPQNSYYNPYYQNIFDQYQNNYALTQSNPNLYSQESVNLFPYKPENAQFYYTNDNQQTFDNRNQYNDPNQCQYHDPKQYQYPNYPYTYEKQPEISYTSYPEYRPENTLDRIWRAWKDVEIKIRNAQNINDPMNSDIIRTMVEHSDGDKGGIGSGKVFNPYATQAININGYLNNQNSALSYPYVNPSYRLY